ncbi:NUDIX hydrolase [Bifidobacterium sp. UBA4282]|uniref:NUDIX hydrolase n=1 Tax=Bifidobacterium sp. UBA4282 TaxID=1946096 RepID=UPI0025B945EC|nr:NUDIX hydrolase [Bifidobacterium sp. UBA4282]
MEDMKQSPVSGIRTGMDTDFIVQSEETVFRGGDDAQFEVICANVARADDGETSAEDVSSPSYPMYFAQVRGGQPSVVCVAVRPDGRVLLVRHWRIATNSDEWEFPRSLGEPGLIVGDTAEYELMKETGIRSLSHHTLQMIHADTGKLRDSIAVVELRVSADRADAAALNDPRLQWLDCNEFEDMVRAGNIMDGITLSAYLIWKSHR